MIDERIQWVVKEKNELVVEETRLNELQELEEMMRKIDEGVMKGSFCFSSKIVLTRLTPQGQKDKNPLEER